MFRDYVTSYLKYWLMCLRGFM